jgi:Undecaprenyl-phosphate glucose phosphotransferase
MSDISHSTASKAASQALPRLSDVSFPHASSVISPTVFSGLVRLAEAALIVATGFVTAALYVAEPDLSNGPQYVLAPLLGAFVASSIWHVLGLYNIPAFTTFVIHLPRVMLGWMSSVAVLVGALFFLKMGSDFSRVWLMLWFAVGFAAITALRVTVQAITRRALSEGRFARRAVVYGSSAHAEDLLRALEADAASDVRICGVFDDRDDVRTTSSIAGYPKRGGRADLVSFCRDNRVDMVLIALPLAADDRIAELKQHIDVLPADIRVAGSASPLKFSKHTYSYVGNVPMIDISDRPISDWGILAKSVFDKAVALIALIVLAPVMAGVTLAVKFESKGPVLFRQKRYGFNNELIEVLKFRSMYTDRCDAAAVKLVTKDDPRVTRVGRIIRKTSLDELPQLFNVLTGQLSLVGPRPHAVQASAAGRLYPDVVGGYFARHKVKPGITGWAQVNGWRGETDTQEKIQKRVEFDLYYIANWSLWLDIQILVRTPGSLLANRDNAY